MSDEEKEIGLYEIDGCYFTDVIKVVSLDFFK